jgi:AcrR family transcriptional regulator
VATASTALRRLDRYDWLMQGIETLRNCGIGAVRVEPMARLLGVTKGSFYWHFKDRGEFLDDLLEYWETEMTDKIGAHLAHTEGEPQRQLLALLEHIVNEEINRYDAAVRAWALYDERAAKIVRRVDERRLAHCRQLFLDMGFSSEQADIRSRMSYHYVVGEYTAFVKDPTLAERLAHVRLRHELLTEC